jgi:hypothetical protein
VFVIEIWEDAVELSHLIFATFSINHLASGIYLAEIRWGSNSSGRVKVVIAR